MSNSKDETYEKHIISEILKSGYPLEIEISDLLDKESSFFPFNTKYFFDEELQVGRSIDIHVYTEPSKDFRNSFAPLSLRLDLAIECKKSDTHAWIFYTRNIKPIISAHIKGQYHSNIPKPKGTSSIDQFEHFLGKFLKLHYSEFDSVAIVYDEIKKAKLTGKKVSSRKEIFDGINQLVKFICYENHQSFKRVRDLGRLAKNENKIIMLLFPIIVFDGDIFEVSLISGEPQIQKKQHLLLQTHFQCPYCHKVESYIIDIVHRQYFEKFLDIFKRYMTELIRFLPKTVKDLYV